MCIRDSVYSVYILEFASIPVISEQEARESLVEYCDKKCCYGKGAAHAMTIGSMQSTSAFHVRRLSSCNTHIVWNLAKLHLNMHKSSLVIVLSDMSVERSDLFYVEVWLQPDTANECWDSLIVYENDMLMSDQGRSSAGCIWFCTLKQDRTPVQPVTKQLLPTK